MNLLEKIIVGLMLTGGLGLAAATLTIPKTHMSEPLKPQVIKPKLQVVKVPQSSIKSVGTDKSAECLALNMYHETRDQDIAGSLAVTIVVLNRVNDNRFPNTICGVIKEGPTHTSGLPIKNKCQFSWYCDGEDDKPYDRVMYNKMYTLAKSILINETLLLDITNGATHYHATYVSPDWSKTKTRTVQIQDHIFYRWEE